jgi:hypothetical protein
MRALAHRILEDLTAAVGDLSGDPERGLARMEPLYAKDVRFQDPLQTIVGWDAFMAMNRRLMARSRGGKLRFDVHDAFALDDQLLVTWSMPVDLKRVPTVFTIEGASHLKLKDGKIATHRDYWDLLGSVAASVPVVAGLYRRFLARVS